ncbi:MAG: DUF6785 family protein [Armatimonadota bacterium]
MDRGEGEAWRAGLSGPANDGGRPAGLEMGEERPAGVSLRAVVVGLLLVGGFGFAIPYLTDIRSAADLGLGPVNGASILALLLVIGPVNAALRRAGIASLDRREVMTVYAMVAATAAISGVGYAVWVNVMVTASQYLATPANRWETMILPHIPPWLQLGDPMAVRWLWEGIPSGQTVPWGAWRHPLMAWGAIAACIYVGSFSLVALVRRDWIEGQRLTFPLAQIPLEAVGREGAAAPYPWRSRVFWGAFSATFVYAVVGLVNAYYPSVPYHGLRWAPGAGVNPEAMPWGPLSRLQFNVSVPAVGIMCLVPVEVSLSFWLFNLAHFAVMVGLAGLGLSGQGSARYGFDPYAFMDFQVGGALVGFGVFVLWQSRRAVVGAVKSWWDSRFSDDDPLEILKPRYALVGLALSTAGLCVIAHAIGVQLPRLLALLFFFYMTALSLTRVIAAAGTNHVECGPQIRYLLDYGLGTRGARPASFVLLNQMDAIFMTEFKVSFMHYAANDTKLFHAVRLRGTSVVASLAAAVAVMLAVGSMSRVYTDYQRGIGSLSTWVNDMVPRWEWGDMVEGLSSPRGPDGIGIAAMVTGAAGACALALLQMHVSWWRLSPVGFLFQPGTGLNRYIWANALVAWSIVTITYRFGGLRLYQRLRPAFFGLLPYR